MTGLNTNAIVDQLVSHAARLGVFDKVNLHEPKSRPPAGLTAAVWFDRLQPHLGDSGLASTSVVSIFMLRIMHSAFAEPQDMIDPRMIDAVDVLFASYHSEFELDGAARNIDLLGEAGTPLSAQAGFLNIDGTIYRVMDVFIPVIISDVWSQNG